MSKRNLVSFMLLAGAAMLISITREWAGIELDPAAASQQGVSVSGSEGNEALMPVTIAVFAMGVVLSIAGRVLRVVLGVLSIIFGVWVVWSAGTIALSGDAGLIGFAGSAIADATGLVTDAPVDFVTEVRGSVWPWVTVAGGVMLALAGLLVTLFAWKWKAGGKRYQTHVKSEHTGSADDRIADWDALSDGEDPSETEPEAPNAGV